MYFSLSTFYVPFRHFSFSLPSSIFIIIIIIIFIIIIIIIIFFLITEEDRPSAALRILGITVIFFSSTIELFCVCCVCNEVVMKLISVSAIPGSYHYEL